MKRSTYELVDHIIYMYAPYQAMCSEEDFQLMKNISSENSILESLNFWQFTVRKGKTALLRGYNNP